MKYPIGTVFIEHPMGDTPLERWLIEQATIVQGIRRLQLVDLGTGDRLPLLTEEQVRVFMEQRPEDGSRITEVPPGVDAFRATKGAVRRGRVAEVAYLESASFRSPAAGSGAGAARNRISSIGPVFNGFGR